MAELKEAIKEMTGMLKEVAEAVRGWKGKAEVQASNEGKGERKDKEPAVEEWLEGVLGRRVQTEEMEEKRCGTRGKILIVKLRNIEDAKEILAMRSEIEEQERVDVDRDLTFLERGNRWCVRKRAREERRAGKEVTEEGAGWLKVVERGGSGGDEVTSRWRWDEKATKWEQTECRVKRGIAEEAKQKTEETRPAQREGKTGKGEKGEKARRGEGLARKWADIEAKMEEWKREKR